LGRSVARKITPQILENSRMTQTDQEIAGSAQFFRSLLGVIEIFNTYWVTTALRCRLAGESASKIPPMTPERTTSVKSR
jgi:hypothetical protein